MSKDKKPSKWENALDELLVEYAGVVRARESSTTTESHYTYLQNRFSKKYWKILKQLEKNELSK